VSTREELERRGFCSKDCEYFKLDAGYTSGTCKLDGEIAGGSGAIKFYCRHPQERTVQSTLFTEGMEAEAL